MRSALVPRLTILAAGAVSFLAAASADAEKIHVLAQRGDVDGVLAELDAGVPLELRSTNMTSDPRVTPLFVAAKFGKGDVVRALLDRGADPTIFFTVPDGIYETGTALHHAARFGYADVVDMLLDAGADPASYHPYIATPYHQALRGGHTEVAERLLAAGAPAKVEEPPIRDEIAAADIADGARVAEGCKVCHGAPAKGGAPGDNGPNLWGVFGRAAAADPAFDYSEAMVGAGIVWDEDSLNSLLARPYQFVPGTSKIQIGMDSVENRAAVIAYLRTLND